MTVPVLSAAKRMCERSGWSLSNLELQKLLYIAHMYFLGETGRPLVNGHFEAWEYGPVHPVLYQKAKIFGDSPVKNIFHSVPDLQPGEEAKALEDVIDGLSETRPGKLVAITHWKDGAWAKHYIPGIRNIVIPDEDIRQEYLDRIDALQRRKSAQPAE